MKQEHDDNTKNCIMKPRTVDEMKSPLGWPIAPQTHRVKASWRNISRSQAIPNPVSALRQRSGAASFRPLSHITLHANCTFRGAFDIGIMLPPDFVYAGTSGTDATAYASRISGSLGVHGGRERRLGRGLGILECQRLRPFRNVSFSGAP
jgi:hypothetical protein